MEHPPTPFTRGITEKRPFTKGNHRKKPFTRGMR